jgi:diguanylate cyclase (GGDEF)-like protein
MKREPFGPDGSAGSRFASTVTSPTLKIQFRGAEIALNGGSTATPRRRTRRRDDEHVTGATMTETTGATHGVDLTIGAPSRARRHLRRAVTRTASRTRVLLFACFLAVFGASLLMATPDANITPERAWSLPFVALVIAFGIAEATALHVEIRKESHSLSLSGIPMMFGLLFLSPLSVALAYIAGAAPAMLLVRKSDIVKTTWNLCLFFAEAALAGFIVRESLGLEMPDSMLEWLVPLVAVLAAELLSLIAVPLVIMVVDVKFRPNLFADVGQSQILAALAGTFTVTALSASVGNPAMILFALVPVLGVGALMHSSGQLSQRHKDLQQLHGFTRALTNERGPRTIDTGLAELVQIMRSRTAGLLIVSDDERPSTYRLLADDTFEDGDPAEVSDLLVETVGRGVVTQLSWSDSDRAGRLLLERLGASKLLGIQVLGEVGRVGVLFVTDRLGMRSEFANEELNLFGSLANTLSARLSNDHLVAQLELQAQHDALTGLANRLTFEVALTASLTKPDQRGVVVMIDLDRFKEINDSLGHDMGDRLLIEVGERLGSHMRTTDMVARFGGDEFALLMSHRPNEDRAIFEERIVEIHRHLCEKVKLDGITFEIGASLGVSQWPQHGTESARVLHRADTAMYHAKRNQLGVVWYDEELDIDAPRRLDLYLSARDALEQHDMHVHFQPKVSVATGEITGAEALARWSHPVHGDISPVEFVPLLSQAGLIGRLTRFVIERAVDAAATFRDAGVHVPIAVNLTPRDLLDPELPNDLRAMLEAARVDPTAIHVEITEDAMVVDFDTSVTVLRELRSLGIRVSIDDFGTGYSSLQHLHRLPVDQIKIDRSFVSRMVRDDSAAAIVRASINLAADLGLTTVAEGVDTFDTLQSLRELGCGEVQGFLVERPVPVHEFLRWALSWSPEDFATEAALIGPTLHAHA